VSGTYVCGEEWAGDISDLYSAVGEGKFLSVFGVNCLQLEELDRLSCEVGGSNTLRKLLIIFRSAYLNRLQYIAV